MRIAFFTALILFVLSTKCIEGPIGPQGARGPQGNSDTVYVMDTSEIHLYTLSGILYEGDKSTEGEYWDIESLSFVLADSGIVQVWVRKGKGYMWITPSWHLSTNGYVRIIDDAVTDPGYEYLINVAFKG